MNNWIHIAITTVGLVLFAVYPSWQTTMVVIASLLYLASYDFINRKTNLDLEKLKADIKEANDKINALNIVYNLKKPGALS